MDASIDRVSRVRFKRKEAPCAERDKEKARAMVTSLFEHRDSAELAFLVGLGYDESDASSRRRRGCVAACKSNGVGKMAVGNSLIRSRRRFAA